LIQDARRDPALAGMRAVAAGFTRYLGVPVFNPAGEPVGTLCFLDGRSDVPLGREDVEFLSLLAMRVSAELERERAIEGRLAEERSLVARLEAMNAQLRRADEEKRRFIATVIHDLRQPLTAMRTMVHVLRSDLPIEERDEALDLLDNRLVAMSGMLNELLEYARIQAGQVPWHLEAADLGALLNDCLDGFASEAADRSVRLERDLDPALGGARTDRARLCHVIGNLVSNALKFTARAGRPEGEGRVVVRARSAGEERWILEVEDNGTGMEAEELDRIFEEFYQGKTAREGGSRDGGRGLGLGLAIVQHLASAMGAEVSVESRPGEGSRFRLTFPRACPPPDPGVPGEK
jgi:two-component system, OmpR family, sensor kinase